VPDGCDLAAAGALPVAFGTSHLALVHRAQLKAGQVSFLPCAVIYFVLEYASERDIIALRRKIHSEHVMWHIF
jgi:hypothetical protein